MNNSRLDRIVEILNNPEEQVSELLDAAGMKIDGEVTEEIFDSACDRLVAEIVKEENLEYIYTKCIEPENRYFYTMIGTELSSDFKTKIEKGRDNRREEDEAFKIEDEETAKEFVLSHKDRESAIKVADKFWHNNETVVFQLLQEGVSWNLIKIIDNPSENLIYNCIVNAYDNTNQIALMDYLLGKNATNDLLLRLITNKNIYISNRAHLMDTREISIPEDIAIKLLEDGEFEKERIIFRIKNPSDEFLYEILSQNMGKSDFIANMLKRFNIPDSVKYKLVFGPTLNTYSFLKNVLGVDKDTKISMPQLLKDFINIPTTGPIEEKRQMLLEMYSKNDEVLGNIDIRLLDEKYVKRLGIDKLNKISIMTRYQSKLLNLNDKEYEFVMNLFDKYSKNGEDFAWEDIFSILINSVDKNRNFINSIEDINQIDMESLTTLTSEVEEKLEERRLKNELAGMYNQGLLKADELEEIQPNVYKAGTDFKILMTSLQALSGKHSDETQYENYKENWNRPKIGVSHFCASYIRNDMLATADIGKVCLGFSEMEPSSLLLMGTTDIGSSSWKKELITGSSSQGKYLAPDDLINQTGPKYNEMDYKRFKQNGERKQPDYILFFRRDGSKEMTPEEKQIWENTQNASKDFGGLPIVVVDIEECLNNERQQVENLQVAYRENPNLDNLKKLYYKIRNNRITTARWGGEFCPEINIEELRMKLLRLQAQQEKEQTKSEGHSQILTSAIEATEDVTRSESIKSENQTIIQLQKAIEAGKQLENAENEIEQ